MKHLKATCNITKEIAIDLEKSYGKEKYKEVIKEDLSKNLSDHIVELAPLPTPSLNRLGELEYKLTIPYYSEYEHNQIQKALLELRHYKALCEDSHGKLVQRRIDEEVLQQLLP